MANSEADFLKIELQLHFLETAMADTAFVINRLLKGLNNPVITAEQRRDLQASEHQLRILLHQIRACAQREIETETQAHEGQRIYHDLLQAFETVTRDFYARATALVSLLPASDQHTAQAALEVLRDFKEGLSTLN